MGTLLGSIGPHHCRAPRTINYEPSTTHPTPNTPVCSPIPLNIVRAVTCLYPLEAARAARPPGLSVQRADTVRAPNNSTSGRDCVRSPGYACMGRVPRVQGASGLHTRLGCVSSVCSQSVLWWHRSILARHNVFIYEFQEVSFPAKLSTQYCN